jgi:3-oxoacyl-[acyl-carrier-protein] synthase-3
VILGPVPGEYGFTPITLGSDGRHAGDVLIPGGGSRLPASPETLSGGKHLIRMDGKAVRDFILEIFPAAADSALRASDLKPDDIALVVTHQPNPVLLRRACIEAGLDPGRLVIVADQTGNIGAGCLPYALAVAQAEGRLRQGDRMLIVGFGAGVTWGSGVLTWGPLVNARRARCCGQRRRCLKRSSWCRVRAATRAARWQSCTAPRTRLRRGPIRSSRTSRRR